MPTFSDLARAAYCPRQLDHARRDDDRGPDERAARRRDLAFRYPALVDAAPATLADLPLDLDPPAYRARLRGLTDRDDWPAVARPDARNVALEGKDCRGVAHKVSEGDPPVPTVVSPGRPPDDGVWEPHRVRAVAAALALSWERERRVERARVEYPASAVVRTVRLTAGNRRRYRETLRTVRRTEGPLPRTDDHGKCGSCPYREPCRGRTRSLRDRLF